MESPVDKLITPNGVEFEIRQWITGRQADFIKQPIMQAVAVKPDAEGGVEMGNVDVEKVEESSRRKIETWVVSVGGKAERVRDLVLDLRESERDFIAGEVENRHSPKKGDR